MIHKADCDYFAGNLCDCIAVSALMDYALADIDMVLKSVCDGSCQGLCSLHEPKCQANSECDAQCSPIHEEDNALCQCHDCYMADPESWTELTHARWTINDLEPIVARAGEYRGKLAETLGVVATWDEILKAVQLMINNNPTRRFDNGRGTIYLNMNCVNCGAMGSYGSSNIKLIEAVHGKTVLCIDCESSELDKAQQLEELS